ncbi:MAG: choice-of-anchor D domain-containing protein, partial [Pseudomonadota bacterium]|nr:choice-of-anchor D domain-containing protein [Pseudomonadota bacterium]
DLRDGAVVSTAGPLTVVGGGNGGGLKVDYYGGAGGSQVTVGGNLINQSSGFNGNGGVDVGNGGMTKSDLLTIDGTLTNSASAVLFVQGNAAGSAQGMVQVNGPASNAGVVLINSGGVLSVGNGAAYTQSAGVTTVNGTLSAASVSNEGGINGTGTIVGAVTNAGTISGGANGAEFTPLTIQGALTNTANGVLLSFESASPATATRVAVAGPLALQGGTLEANAVNGLTFAPGQSATVATFTPGSMSGLFEYLQNGNGSASTHPTYLNLGNGTTLDVNYNVNAGNVELTTVATPSSTAESWKGGSGLWSTGSDWNSGAAPLSYSDVTLGAANGAAVTLNQDSTINSLSVQSGNALQYQSGTPAALTVGQNVSVASGGTLALTASADRLTTGGTIDNGGTLASVTGSTIQVMNFGGASNALSNTGTLGVGGQIQGNGALSNSTGATVELQGGTVATTQYVNAGTTVGDGTVVARVSNTGTLTASGGTLSAEGGFAGTGTVQTDAGGTLSLGANSTAGTLANDGALALNGHSITVSGAYQNAAAGTGNAFNNHAGVSGGGEILAAGTDPSGAQTVALNGGPASSADVVMNFGNVRVGASATQSYTIGNANSGGPALMGAIQTAAGGGTLTDARLSGSGVSAQNWGPVQAGAHSSVYQVTFDANTAGALTGQSVHLVNNFDNTNAQNISITGAAYAQAVGQLNNTAAHPDSFDFGTIQVGQTVTSNALSVSNVASGPSGYVEDLNASFGTVGTNGGTGGARIVGNGAIEGLLAGATNDSALSISVTGTQAGSIQSGIGVNFYTAGTVAGHSDGLGAALVGSATVPVAGTIQTNVNVVNAADPVVNNAPIDLGNVRQNAASPSAYVSLTNEATTAPQAALDASISGDSAVSASGNFSALDPGQTNDTALQVGLNTASAGHVSGLATVDLVSDASNIGGCAAHCTMNLPAQQVAVSGNVYRIADPTADTASVTLAARVGGSAPSAAISVTNVSPDAYTEGLAATLGATPQGWTHSGSISNLVAGGTDASSLQVGLSTATAGVFNGSESVNFTSNGLIDHAQALGVGSATVALQGDVYTTAVEHLGTAAVNFGVVHVGQAVADQTVAVSNTAAQSALNDTLTGQLSMQPGSAGVFSTGGTLGAGVGAGQTNSSSLTVGLNTGVAGVYSGNAQFTGESHDAQLTDLQLATLGIAVSGQVNNYANAIFQLAAGGGTLSRSGSMYTLDLGNLTQGSAVSSLLSVLNDVSGPADNFGGTFAYGSLNGISLSGANWNAQSCTQSGYAFCLGAQGMLGGLGIDVNTGTLGTFTDTIALNGMGFYQGASYSPYQQNLTLTVEGNIITGGGTSLPEPGTLPLFAAGAALLLGLARRRRAVARREGVRRC